MVENELEKSLKEGAITQEEYEELKARRDGTVSSRGKNVASFFLTILGIIAVLFGTCIMNIGIVAGMKSDALTGILMIAWPLFPVILFGRIAHKTKNAGIKWAVIFLAVCALAFAAMMMG